MTCELRISKYEQGHEVDVLSAIRRDPDWDLFTDDKTIGQYKRSLLNDVTYVCYVKNEFCGYVRGLLDPGLAVYISELYVRPEWRNNGIGSSLIEHVKAAYPDLSVYALSDEDLYYEKKGYKKAGSIFRI